jgi:cell wall-associated NlpC family hydrolase
VPAPRRAVAAAAGGLVLLSSLALAAISSGSTGILTADARPSEVATAEIPAHYLTAYVTEAQWCPGLSWTVLAAVGSVESGNGHNDGPSPAGAVGPMQFESATFTRYALPVPVGGALPPSPWDPTDAAAAAARYLCSLGAVADPRDALVAYNCGNSGPVCQAASAGYAAQVLALADRYGMAAAGESTGAGMLALAYASTQIGVPYRWAGEQPGGGFDCSGLVQWAFAQAGLSLPRTAQAQLDAGPPLPPGTGPEPGNLLFFGTSPAAASHVGIYAGTGLMIDAPHTGATVRLEPVPTQVRDRWGGELLVGITRP